MCNLAGPKQGISEHGVLFLRQNSPDLYCQEISYIFTFCFACDNHRSPIMAVLMWGAHYTLHFWNNCYCFQCTLSFSLIATFNFWPPFTLHYFIFFILLIFFCSFLLIPFQIDPETGKCMRSGFWPSDQLNNIIGTIVVVTQFLLPLLILLYCYGRILQVLTKRIDSKFNNGGAQSDTFQLARTNTIKTLLIVALCFVICWSNNQVYYLMFHLGYDLDWNGTYYKFTVLMVFVNCIVNPFIYLIQYKDYQEALRKFCGCTNQKQIFMEDSESRPNTISGSVSTKSSIQISFSAEISVRNCC